MMTEAGRRKLYEQQELELDPSLPWGGRSPRSLTEAYQRFSLRQETTTVDEFFVWDEEVVNEQYRRFIAGSSNLGEE